MLLLSELRRRTRLPVAFPLAAAISVPMFGAVTRSAQPSILLATGGANNNLFLTSTQVASLKTHASGNYVDAANSITPLIANRTAIGPWEEFGLIYD
ncbi:MAG TPA: hypothetical protein VGS97_24250 [Actinocrinis sp.]|uniref:hypothetical protein n=1 Tax=Actinocrinis sp. TaxID=1920516 RepID=UPI002DDC94D2|nr:hypothetical protein [Actinocrinis sp.]HEV2347230.1 hypothetical protein [Actinocrinis sp.]